MSLLSPRVPCRHGNLGDCSDCLQYSLEGISAYFNNADSRFVLRRDNFHDLLENNTRLIRDSKEPLSPSPERVFWDSESVHAPAESESHRERSPLPARAPPAPANNLNRFQGVRAVGSAFSADPSLVAIQHVPATPEQEFRPTASPTPQSEGSSRRQRLANTPLSHPERLGVTISTKRRMKWTSEESDLLVEGFYLFGEQWEKIRAQFPQLRKYKGMQLKDRHRHMVGRR